MPGLDGLRAVAVLAVIAYHLQIGFAKGGLLGVGIFFTLAGYLITDILLEGWVTRRLKLGNFWLARARRLLPALFLMLIVVVAFLFISWLVPDQQRPDWVTGAKSRVVLQGTGDWLMALLPDDPENTILKRFKKNKPDEDTTDAEPAAPGAADGYSKPARDSLKKLIDGKPAGR